MAEPVPLASGNAVTGLMANFGYGKGYQYAHKAEDKLTDMQCLPDNLKDRSYFRPTDQGLEKRLKEKCRPSRNGRGKGRAEKNKLVGRPYPGRSAATYTEGMASRPPAICGGADMAIYIGDR